MERRRFTAEFKREAVRQVTEIELLRTREIPGLIIA